MAAAAIVVPRLSHPRRRRGSILSCSCPWHRLRCSSAFCFIGRSSIRKLAQTVRQYRNGVVSYFDNRLTQGAIEAINGTINSPSDVLAGSVISSICKQLPIGIRANSTSSSRRTRFSADVRSTGLVPSSTEMFQVCLFRGTLLCISSTPIAIGLHAGAGWISRQARKGQSRCENDTPCHSQSSFKLC